MASIKTKAYGASGSILNSLKRMDIEREAPKDDEVHIDILYCGVCHSDLHQVKNDWHNTLYPCVPGHEIVGKVIATGSAVTKFKVGDTVGVGCMVDSCGECQPCRHDEENYCQGPDGFTLTYNGYMQPREGVKMNTFGGYSDNIVVKEHFVLKVPDALDIQAVAPILKTDTSIVIRALRFDTDGNIIVKASPTSSKIGIGKLQDDIKNYLACHKISNEYAHS